MNPESSTKAAGISMINNETGTIRGCLVGGDGNTQIEGERQVAGLVSENRGVIERCGTLVKLSGRYELGGLVSRNENGEIRESYSDAAITGPLSGGGLCAINAGLVENCYSRSSITTEKDGDLIAGLVGFQREPFGKRTIDVAVINSVAYGRIKANGAFYGLSGSNIRKDAVNSAAVENSFWDTDSVGTQESKGGQGISSQEAKNPDTYRSAGWDLAETWKFGNDGYPILRNAVYPLGK